MGGKPLPKCITRDPLDFLVAFRGQIKEILFKKSLFITFGWKNALF